MILGSGIGFHFTHFNGSFATESERWGHFGDFLNPFIGVANLVALAALTVFVYIGEEQRERIAAEENRRLRLAEQQENERRELFARLEETRRRTEARESKERRENEARINEQRRDREAKELQLELNKPVLTFTRELGDAGKYSVRNAGKGPAINIVVKHKNDASKPNWDMTVICYSLTPGTHQPIFWTDKKEDQLIALYYDALSARYYCSEMIRNKLRVFLIEETNPDHKKDIDASFDKNVKHFWDILKS